MKLIHAVLIAIVALLSGAAGAAKVFAVPEEVQFLSGFGLNSIMIMLYGLIQIVGALFLFPAKLRLVGVYIVIAGFALSSIFIFASGNISFGLISIVPIIMASVIAVKITKNKIANFSS